MIVGRELRVYLSSALRLEMCLINVNSMLLMCDVNDVRIFHLLVVS